MVEQFTVIEERFRKIAKYGNYFVISSDNVDAAQSMPNSPDVNTRCRDTFYNYVTVALERAQSEMTKTVRCDRLTKMQLRHREQVSRTDDSCSKE